MGRQYYPHLSDTGYSLINVNKLPNPNVNSQKKTELGFNPRSNSQSTNFLYILLLGVEANKQTHSLLYATYEK